MLNEFYSIHQGLSAIDEKPEIKHPDIQEPGLNNVTFRVMLDEDGTVSSVRLMQRDQIQECWSLGNKQTQFPAVKVKKPLFLSAHDKYIDWKARNSKPTPESCRAFIKEVVAEGMPPLDCFSIWPDYRESILSRSAQLEVYDYCEGVTELYKRYGKSATGVEILYGVREALIAGALEGLDKEHYKPVFALLFGEKLKPNKTEVADALRVTLLLDCFPSEDIHIYASSKRNVPHISRALFDQDLQSDNQKEGVCSVSGQHVVLVDKTFPEEKLAVVGPTILFAKNDETSGATVARYGQSKADGIALSAKLSHELAAAIAHISHEKHKGKTWAKLPNGSLLLAFCHKDPNLAVVPLFTGESEVEDFDDYLDFAKEIIASFKGHELVFDTSVDFIEIIKVDKANRKINFSTSIRVSELASATEAWKNACNNVPNLELDIQLRDKSKASCSPWAISPQQVMALTQNQYIRSGIESTRSIPLSFADCMKLFFGKQSQINLINILRRVEVLYRLLFEYVAQSKRQGMFRAKARVKTNLKLNAQALSAVTLLSILLFQIGRPREVYVTDLAYQLGQFCAAMDELHIGYCKAVRNGELPNTLLGNQAYGMLLNDANKGMGFISMRLRPYDSWVKKEISGPKQTKDKAILSAYGAYAWMRRQAETLNELVNKAGDSAHQEPTYKTELMLGYLAGRPFGKKEKTENDTGKQGENK